VSSQAQALGNSGAPFTIQWQGRAIRARLIDQTMASAFEKALFDRALKALEARKPYMTPERYEVKQDEIAKLYEDGEYGMVSQHGTEMMKKIPGIMLLASLIFDVDQMTLVMMMQEKKEEMLFIIDRVVHDSLPTAPKGQNGTVAPSTLPAVVPDPNVQPAA